MLFNKVKKMTKKNLFPFFLLLVLSSKAECQTQKEFFSTKIKINESFFEKNLGKKTVVFYSFKKNIDVKKTINKSHKNFVSLGIDVIYYINYDDFYISKEVQMNFLNYFISRGVDLFIFYQKETNEEKINFFVFNKITSNLKDSEGTLSFIGTNSFELIKQKITKSKPKPTTFLFSPTPEFLNNINIKKFTKIKNPPKLLNEKVGVVFKDDPKEIKLKILSLFNGKTKEVEKKEDYRFYFSNGINYIIRFVYGTTISLKNIYKLDTLMGNEHNTQTILVLENTASQNKYFYFNKIPTNNKIKLTQGFVDATQKN